MTRPTLKHSLLFAHLVILSLCVEVSLANNPLLEFSMEKSELIVGERTFDENSVSFRATYHDEEIPRYVIDLAIAEKNWSTTITYPSENESTVSVVADDIKLSALDREQLRLTSEDLYQHAIEIQDDAQLRYLLVQMTTYWSRSPANYTIETRQLGG